MTESSVLGTIKASAIFQSSGKIPCSNDKFRISVKGITKTSLWSLKLVTGIFFGLRAFRLFNWDISFCHSSWVTGLCTNEFNGALSGLKQFLATESPLKMMKNAYWFTWKTLFVLKIFKFLSWLFGNASKRLKKIRLI